MKAWVTGGAGFLGSHLAEALAGAGHTVTVVDDYSTGVPENLVTLAGRIRILPCAVQSSTFRDAFAEDPPAILFHLAGDARVSLSVEDPRADCDRNLLPTLALLDAVRDLAPETRVLYASTGAVYGGNAERPFHESDGLCPVSPYAVAKLASERYCYVYHQNYGLKTASLRMFSVYGPRQTKQVVYDLIRKIHANPASLPLFGDGCEERDFSHVINMIDAFLLLAEKAPFQGEVFNAAGDEIVSIRRLAELLCEMMNATPEFRFSGQTRPGDSRRWVADTGRIRALGYTPRFCLRDGLRDTLEWYMRRQP